MSAVCPPQWCSSTPLGLASSSSTCRDHVDCSVSVTPGHDPGHTPRQVTPGLLTLSESDYAQLLAAGSFSHSYQLVDASIASGQWTSVYKCQHHLSGDQYIAKFCSKSRNGADCSYLVRHEVAVMLLCKHCPHIAKIHEIFDTENELIIVMELIEGGDLQYVLDDDQVPYESDVARYIVDVLHGLQHLHQMHIAHMDIKPQNVVLTGAFPEAQVKLCDLEVARDLGGPQGLKLCDMLGTPDYVAPEILNMGTVTLAVDIWSLGVLVYVLLTGFTPFGGDSDAETFQNISRGEVDFPEELFEDISDAAKDFIGACLKFDPRSRSTVDELLGHHWLTSGPRLLPDQQPLQFQSADNASIHGSVLSLASLISGTDSEHTLGGTDDVSSVCQMSQSDRCELGVNAIHLRQLRRTLSKSREAIAERAQRSNLNKCISRLSKRMSDSSASGRPRDQCVLKTALASRASAPGPSRPRWRRAGAFPEPGPNDRVNSFRVRNEYQNQVVAHLSGTGKNAPGPVTTPFARRCSLRGDYRSFITGFDATAGSVNGGATNSLQRRENIRDVSAHSGPKEAGSNEYSETTSDGMVMSQVQSLSSQTIDSKQDVFSRLYYEKVGEGRRKSQKHDMTMRKNIVDRSGNSVDLSDEDSTSKGRIRNAEEKISDIITSVSSVDDTSVTELTTGRPSVGSVSKTFGSEAIGKKNSWVIAQVEPKTKTDSLNCFSSLSSGGYVGKSKISQKQIMSSVVDHQTNKSETSASAEERGSSFHYIKNCKKSGPTKAMIGPIDKKMNKTISPKKRTKDASTSTDDSLLISLLEDTVKRFSESLATQSKERGSTKLSPHVINSIESLLKTCHSVRSSHNSSESKDTMSFPAIDTCLSNQPINRGGDRFRLKKSLTDTRLANSTVAVKCGPLKTAGSTGDCLSRRFSLCSDLGSSDAVSDTAESVDSSPDRLSSAAEPNTKLSRSELQHRHQPHSLFALSNQATSVTGSPNSLRPWVPLCSGSVSKMLHVFSDANHAGAAASQRRVSEPFTRVGSGRWVITASGGSSIM